MYKDDNIVEFPALKEAQEKLDAKRKQLADILREAGPTYDMSQVKSLAGDTHAKVAEIRKFNDEIDEAKGKVDELLVVARAAGEAKRHEEGVQKGAEPGNTGGSGEERRGRRKSLGELVVESKAFKNYDSGTGMGPSVRLEGIDLKALFSTPQINGGGGQGWDPEDLRTGVVVDYATRPAPQIVDFIPQTTTTMSTVLYMEETTFTNNAAERFEADTYAESALALTERSSEVRSIATFLPVTEEQLEDEPRAQAYINNRLPFMIRQRLDSQILGGNGTAPNLKGTENVSGINTQALGGDSIPDALYKAMVSIRSVGYAEPSVVFIAPAKWQSVQLLKTADGVYIWGHPSQPGPMSIWGVPVVQTTAVTSTKALLGDYRNFSELSVRRGIDVAMSTSHSTFFVEGKLAIKASMRAALIHYRPAAFAAVTGL